MIFRCSCHDCKSQHQSTQHPDQIMHLARNSCGLPRCEAHRIISNAGFFKEFRIEGLDSAHVSDA